MPVKRYWRAVGLEAYGAGDLELSEFHLLAAGARVDAPAALTASAAPDVSGALTALKDDALATAARWSGQAVKTLALQWDFGGAPADVDDIRLSGDGAARFPLILRVQWSDDGIAWFDGTLYSGIQYPGAAVKTSSSSGAAFGDAFYPNVSLLLRGNGLDGATTTTDLSTAPKAVTFVGNAKVSTTISRFGGSSFFFDGSGDYLDIPSFGANTFFQQDWTMECWALGTSSGQTGTLMGSRPIAAGNYGICVLAEYAGLKLSRVIAQTWDNAGNFFPVNFSVISASNADSTGDYVHLVKLGTTYTLLCNGVLCGSSTLPQQPSNSNVPNLYIGAACTPAQHWATTYFTGYIDEVRVTTSVARYASSFTPPSVEFPNFAAGGILQNRVRGRAAFNDSIALGTGPAIFYGTPQIAQPFYFGIESGSVKDTTSGVLGQGIGRIRGTVKEKGTPTNIPLKRRVRLHRERDGLVVREAWSDAITGDYDFQYIDELQIYSVVSYDHLRNYRAVIADNAPMELMPA